MTTTDDLDPIPDEPARRDDRDLSRLPRRERLHRLAMALIDEAIRRRTRRHT